MAKEIILTKGMVAIVDDEDFDYLNNWKWHYNKTPHSKTGYAMRTSYENGKKTIRMHRLLFEYYKQDIDGEIDHIDRDGLNNQKSNLRHCSRSENIRNVSSWGGCKYKGVSFYKRIINNKTYEYYRARIQVNKKSILIGLFKDEIEAAKEYNKAAKKYFGEFANLNKI